MNHRRSNAVLIVLLFGGFLPPTQVYAQGDLKVASTMSFCDCQRGTSGVVWNQVPVTVYTLTASVDPQTGIQTYLWQPVTVLQWQTQPCYSTFPSGCTQDQSCLATETHAAYYNAYSTTTLPPDARAHQNISSSDVSTKRDPDHFSLLFAIHDVVSHAGTEKGWQGFKIIRSCVENGASSVTCERYSDTANSREVFLLTATPASRERIELNVELSKYEWRAPAFVREASMSSSAMANVQTFLANTINGLKARSQ